MKIGVIGMGWVGSSVAVSVLHSGLATELLLSDVRTAVAEGEAMDLAHGAAFYPTAKVRAASIAEMRDADAVVVAAGRGGKPEESRLDLVRDNARIVGGIARELQGLKGLLVIVTNPVDVLTHVALEASGLPPHRVFGTGTMLDTARFRQILGAELGIEPRSIHAHVVGEHGDSEVALWSSVSVGGVLLTEWTGWDHGKEAGIATQVQRAAYEIIARKGSTNHAIGLVTAALLKWTLHGGGRVLNVTRLQEGAFGFKDVCLSLPTVMTPQGAQHVLEPKMSDKERELLERSAQVLRGVKASLA